MSLFECLNPPDDWLGAVLPLDLDVGTNEHLAMVITHLTVYPKGFSFSFTALTKEDPGSLCEEALGIARQGDRDPDGLPLNLGVEFADGRRADRLASWTSIHGDLAHGSAFPERLPPDPDLDIFLHSGGAESSDRRYSGRNWVWPLPPPGSLTFWMGWPAAGLQVQPTSIDSAPLLEAATAARPLWSDA